MMTMGTTIKLEVETKKRLEDLGRKGETFDSIVNRVLDSKKVGR